MNAVEKYIDNALFFRWVYEPDDDLNAYWDLYVRNHPEEEYVLRSLKRELMVFRIENQKLSENQKKELSKKIAQKMRQKQHVGNLRVIGGTMLKYAVVALLFGIIGASIVLLRSKGGSQFDKLQCIDIPGMAGNPTLILADGSKINLNSRLPEIKLNGDQLVFNGDSVVVLPQSGDALNQLIIPYGSRGQIVLNDHSVVWLNAGSRLFFPTKFADAERNVFLFGEAFFEVEHSHQRPFFVETADYRIRVLGTKFNVSAYLDDNLSQTILTEGSIELTMKKDTWIDESHYLKPNEMFSYSHLSGRAKIQNVNPGKYILWKDGIVPFENEDLSEVVAKIERYYDIQIRLKDLRDGDIKLDGKLNLKNDKYEVLYYISKVANRKMIKKNERYFIIE